MKVISTYEKELVKFVLLGLTEMNILYLCGKIQNTWYICPVVI